MHSGNTRSIRKIGREEIFEIIIQYFSKLITDTKLHIQETQKTKQNKYQKPIPVNIVCKLQETKDKEKSLKKSRPMGGSLIFRGINVRIALNFSSETMQVRRQ